MLERSIEESVKGWRHVDYNKTTLPSCQTSLSRVDASYIANVMMSLILKVASTKPLITCSYGFT